MRELYEDLQAAGFVTKNVPYAWLTPLQISALNKIAEDLDKSEKPNTDNERMLYEECEGLLWQKVQREGGVDILFVQDCEGEFECFAFDTESDPEWTLLAHGHFASTRIGAIANLLRELREL